MKKTFVTKPHFPPVKKFKSYIDRIWENEQLTNLGPLHNELEGRLRDFLGLEHFHFVTNGTIALQIAIRSLGITEGEIITTPFSYVATTTSILWERCKPVFVDVDPDTFCMDPEKIEQAVTPATKAIMPVHVYGFPCDVDAIEAVAEKQGLKVIYDAAHAFGCRYKGRSLLDYGDVSTCSFHATKVFHTIEGGCVVSHDPEVARHITLMRSFGHIYDDYYEAGLNAKASEMQAAMGLCNLDDFEEIVKARKERTELYDSLLPLDKIKRPIFPKEFEYNYGYYAAIFEDGPTRARVKDALEQNNIFPRRYFYPSLNTLPYLEERAECPVSESLADRTLCLPLHARLEEDTIKEIVRIVRSVL